jgi:hypothetical protein
MTYSLVDASRAKPNVEVAPPPGKRPPHWLGLVAAVVTALGGGAGIRELIHQGDEQIQMLAEIKASLVGLKESQERIRGRLDALEQRESRNFTSNETRFAVIGAALKQEGYSARGMPDEQVEFASTKNAKRPVEAVDNSGRQLVVPQPQAPPGLYR